MSRYAAFISYSHADHAIARWLHRGLEGYRLPKALIGTPSPYGPVPRRLPPVFRDRDELPASGDLGEELRAALAASRFQIVICSPRSATSKWVNEEILSFKRLHGESRTLALIVDGEPYAGDARECFPPALRFQLAPDGTLSDRPAEPIAADIRPGKDGKRLALLKLIAGISGLKLDALARRDAARRQRALALIAIVSTAIALVTIGLAIYAESQRRIAERQRRLTDRSLEFLIGTFAIANPATENPRTITALTILDRASKSAATEFARDPMISARLLRATGDIYFNLGLQQESARDLNAALARTPDRGEERALILLKLSALAKNRSDPEATARLVDRAEAAYDRNAGYAPALDAQVAERRGDIAYLNADYPLAARLFADAGRDYAALPGDNREAMGRILMREARARNQTREFALSDALYARATRIYAARFGMNDLRTAGAFQNRAFARFELGDLDQAVPLMQRAVTTYDRVLEGDHPRLADAQLLLGRMYAAERRFVESRAAFERARAMYARIYGPDNAVVGDVDFYAAEAEGASGRFDEAMRHAANVKRIYDLNYGADDPDQAELLLLRSRIFAAAGRQAEARAACVSALELQQKLELELTILDETRAVCARYR